MDGCVYTHMCVCVHTHGGERKAGLRTDCKGSKGSILLEIISTISAASAVLHEFVQSQKSQNRGQFISKDPVPDFCAAKWLT